MCARFNLCSATEQEEQTMIENDLLTESKRLDLEKQRRNEEAARNRKRRASWIDKWYRRFGCLPARQTNVNIIKIRKYQYQRRKGHQQTPPEAI